MTQQTLTRKYSLNNEVTIFDVADALSIDMITRAANADDQRITFNRNNRVVYSATVAATFAQIEALANDARFSYVSECEFVAQIESAIVRVVAISPRSAIVSITL